MKLLFDSRGQFIASEEGGRLHSPLGGNIGHYRKAERIFIDQAGRYLGEVVLGNRLMYNPGSPFREVGFATLGVYGGIGTIGDPGSAGAVGPVAGYEDVPAEWLDS
jgi:hypothetical protein